MFMNHMNHLVSFDTPEEYLKINLDARDSIKLCMRMIDEALNKEKSGEGCFRSCVCIGQSNQAKAENPA